MRGSRTLGILLFLFAARANAQVNIEPLRAKLPDQGVAGAIDARLDGRHGNVDGVTAGGSLLLGARSEPHSGFFAASGDYAEFSGEVKSARYFAHLRYAFTFLPWLWGEAFGQLEHDRFEKLTQRRLIGAGPRFRLVKTDTFSAFYSTAYMLEHEQLDLPPSAPDDRTTLAHRWSNTLAALFKPDDRITLSQALLFQPRFDAFGDYRILNVTSAEFAITKLLTASIVINVRYDSEPPTTVEGTDYEVVNELGVRF